MQSLYCVLTCFERTPVVHNYFSRKERKNTLPDLTCVQQMSVSFSQMENSFVQIVSCSHKEREE